MDVETAIRSRRSIRRFSDKDVPEQVVVDILDSARWSPSWANTQPWSVFAVTGETLEKIKTAYREMIARTRELMASRATATGRSDRGPGNLEFFAAPWLVLFAIDGRLQPEYACFDTGLLVQTFCLAAHERGLGSCIMAMAVGYPEDLHAILPAAEGKRFVVAVALGYPDLEAAINRFDRSRAELSEIVSFAG